LVAEFFVERHVGVAIDRRNDSGLLACGREFLDVGDDRLVIAMTERCVLFHDVGFGDTFGFQERAQNFVRRAWVHIVGAKQHPALGRAAVFAHQVFNRRNGLLVRRSTRVENVFRELFAFVLHWVEEEAIEFFGKSNDKTCHRIAAKLRPLADVGLGYVRLGQSSSTLSGGESQRVKLAFYLSQEKSTEKMLFIFDEPTTGLHFHDISKLMKSLNALVEHGHSVILIEHNVEVIKCSDWVIDLGPEGGEKGGYVVFEGTPEQLAQCDESYTAKFLKQKLNC